MFGFLKKNSNEVIIRDVYERIALSARQPALFLNYTIPDTINGRIESIAIHMVLILRALGRMAPPADEFAKDLTDFFYDQIEGTMREVGISDIGLPKRIRRFAGALLGRAHVYHEALESHNMEKLVCILEKDLLHENGEAMQLTGARGLAAYIFSADETLKNRTFDEILFQELPFSALLSVEITTTNP